MSQFDPGKVFLSDGDIKVLREIAEKEIVPYYSIDDDTYDRLFDCGLVKGAYCDKYKKGASEANAATISKNGHIYLNYLSESRKKTRLETRRYWFNTTIATIALLKAFLPEIRAGLAFLLRLITQ